MDESEAMVISATVVTTDHEKAARAAEVLARAAAGLVLDEISVSLMLYRGGEEEIGD